MKYRIIIADDERKILQLIKKLGHWEKLDIEIVDECGNGQEALESILRNHPDIVLSDIKMPVYDGIRLIEKTKEHGEDPFFILLSGYRHFEYARSAIQLNVMDYLLKPIDEAQLNDTLEKVCLRVEQKRKMVQWKELEAVRVKMQLQPFWDTVMWEQDETVWRKSLSSVSACNERLGTEFQEGCFQFVSTMTNLNAMMDQQDSIFNDKVEGFVQRIFSQIAVYYSLTTYKGRLIFMGNNIIDYSQVLPLSRFAVSEFITEKEMNRLCDCIRYLNREGLGELFSLFYQRAGSLNNAYPRDMRDAMVYLLNRIRSLFPEQEWKDKAEEIVFYAFVESRSFQMMVKNIYLKLDAYVAEEEKRMTEKMGKPMGEAVRFMKEHYQDAISMEDAAESAGVSVGYLSKLFKREMDMGFNEYLTQIRLEKSQELLAETSLSVKEIAAMVGYPDEKYYSKLFKKVTGIKPTDYRRLYGG